MDSRWVETVFEGGFANRLPFGDHFAQKSGSSSNMPTLRRRLYSAALSSRLFVGQLLFEGLDSSGEPFEDTRGPRTTSKRIMNLDR